MRWFSLGTKGLLSAVLATLTACGNGVEPGTRWQHATTGVYDAAISNDGRFAAVSTIVEGTFLWDLKANRPLHKWRHGENGENAISNISFSPNGNYVITADKRTYVVWDTAAGRALGYWSVDANIIDVAISNSRDVLLGLTDGRALHINLATQRRLEVIAHRHEPVASVALSADGRLAVTGGGDGRAVVWEAGGGTEVSTFQHKSRVTIVAMDERSQRAFSADNQGGAFVWDLKSGKQISRLDLKPRMYIVSSARFSADGGRLLTGFPGREIRLWNSSSGAKVTEWRVPTRREGWIPHGAVVYAVAFGEGERSIIAEASNGLGQRWSLDALL
jgi:WD40 repeat protein